MNKKVDFLLLIIWLIAIITTFLFLNTWFSTSKFCAAGGYRMHCQLKQGARLWTPWGPLTLRLCFGRMVGNSQTKLNLEIFFHLMVECQPLPLYSPKITNEIEANFCAGTGVGACEDLGWRAKLTNPKTNVGCNFYVDAFLQWQGYLWLRWRFDTHHHSLQRL